MNIKEFAKILNIAPSTVSRALLDSHEISDATKQRVREKAKELRFSPNPIASNLRRQKNKTIAIVVPDITNHFFAKVIEGIESIAQQKGYHLLIYFTFDNYLKEVETLQLLINGRVGGAVISLSANTNEYEHIKEIKDNNVPLVFFDRICNEVIAANITTNNKESGYNATQHLIDKGCKKILFLSFSEHSITAIERKEGYLEALKKNKLNNKLSLIINCSINKVENIELITNILKSEKNIDGIVASSENLSFLCYEICKKQNIKIPEQIKLVGFTNSPLAEYLNPSLTCIYQPAITIGNEVAKVLFKTIEKTKVDYTDTKIELKAELIERESSK